MGLNHLATGFVAAVLLAAGSASAEEVMTPIRDFDIATIEALGQHMYRQDQEAWKATDILLLKHTTAELQASKTRGWIVDEAPQRDIVRFIRQGPTGPEAAYDVTFVSGADPILSDPQPRSLSAEELAQYNARSLAASNFDFHCTDVRPNTVAFRDPQRDGWLVWVMTATTDPSLQVLGGHIRYSISADGKTIISQDKLAKGCGLLPKADNQGDKPVAQTFANIVSLTPVETHVFANFAYHLPLYVSTMDGLAWKIDQGHISTVDQDFPGTDGVVARALAGVNEVCKPILTKLGDANSSYSIGDETKVISVTEKQGAFVLEPPASYKIASIMCGRQDIVPSPNDYKVLLAGFPLYIDDTGYGHPKRTGVLEVSGGEVRFRMIDGKLTDELSARVQKRLDALQKSLAKGP